MLKATEEKTQNLGKELKTALKKTKRYPIDM